MKRTMRAILFLILKLKRKLRKMCEKTDVTEQLKNCRETAACFLTIHPKKKKKKKP
jgi:hypothetical protein